MTVLPFAAEDHPLAVAAPVVPAFAFRRVQDIGRIFPDVSIYDIHIVISGIFYVETEQITLGMIGNGIV